LAVRAIMAGWQDLPLAVVQPFRPIFSHASLA